MNDFPQDQDSDTSDEDYVPGGKQEDIPSEIDSDGDPEEPLSDSEETTSRSRKRQKPRKKKRKVSLRNEESGRKENKVDAVEEEKKVSIDDIWADFKKDTGFKSKNVQKVPSSDNSKSGKSSENASQSSTNKTSVKPPEKVKITQIFEFAGEEVKVEKEVAVDSAEARLLSKPDDSNQPKTSLGKRSGGLSGIGNVLSQLSKKPKISTLEKTKLDWDNYKKEHAIEEELQTHNRGKDGYLDRQDFLQRADLRRFEIEKNIRSIERSKRFNSAL
ncbi:hypothetical protein JTB14_005326 [Gonioctena quinquepunctata]|nr:hypothetical protein JTB14_005326 [Gonioctena quinquepunctata]